MPGNSIWATALQKVKHGTEVRYKTWHDQSSGSQDRYTGKWWWMGLGRIVSSARMLRSAKQRDRPCKKKTRARGREPRVTDAGEWKQMSNLIGMILTRSAGRLSSYRAGIAVWTMCNWFHKQFRDQTFWRSAGKPAHSWKVLPFSQAFPWQLHDITASRQTFLPLSFERYIIHVLASVPAADQRHCTDPGAKWNWNMISEQKNNLFISRYIPLTWLTQILLNYSSWLLFFFFSPFLWETQQAHDETLLCEAYTA